MSEIIRTADEPSAAVSALDVEVVVPVYNEQATLETSIRALHDHLHRTMPERWRITIADNASVDATGPIADRLAAELDGVAAVHIAQKGRGRALSAVWATSPAAVLVYVDEDLSTDLRALRPLIAPLLSGHSDLAIGTRLARGSRVVRGGKREFVSRTYNVMLRTLMGVQFSDAQCGFKAIRADVARALLPLVHDDAWFFDTELLVLAERAGLRIHEVPVDWVDDTDSSVDIVATATADVRGMWRLSRDLARGILPVDDVYARYGRHPLRAPTAQRAGLRWQLVSFGGIGVLSTIAYAVLYVAFTHAMGAQTANLAALLVTAVANTAANRRVTFGIRGRARVTTHHVQALAVFGVAWLITAGALFGLHAALPTAGAGRQVIVLTAANVVATGVRFVLLRGWVFRRRPRTSSDAACDVGGTPPTVTVPIPTLSQSAAASQADSETHPLSPPPPSAQPVTIHHPVTTSVTVPEKVSRR